MSLKAMKQDHTDLSQKRVLIIEDLSEMRTMLKSLVSNLGYTNIDVESSGQFAVKRILETYYDVILSDFNLGGSINGQQILETARKHYSQDQSNIFIMVTADTAYGNVAGVVEYQPDSYIVKPFTPATFVKRFEFVKTQKKAFEEVNSARKSKDFVLMEKSAKQLLKQHPKFSSQCLKAIGESLYSRGLYKDAKNHYSRVLQGNAELPWALYGIALCEVKLGAMEAAIQKLEETIGLSQHFLSAYDLLADAQEKLGKLADAQATLLKVLGVSSQSIERSVRLAKISVAMKDWDVAEQGYSRVIRLTRETDYEKIEYYYELLKCITYIIENGDHNPKLVDKFKRAITRLRKISKTSPSVIANSFRIEIQQLLARGHRKEAIKSWHHWNKMIKDGYASTLTEAQENTLKKLLELD